VARQVEAIGMDVTRFQLADEVFGGLTEYGYGAFASMRVLHSLQA
jgi:hypothetical protein